MSEEKFKLPGSSYEELAKIIKGYGSMSKPASLDDISKLTTLHGTIVSRNAGFLVEIGVIDPGAKKSATDSGRALARALEHEMPDEISTKWRERVEATEFLTQLLTSIRIRRGMTEETLTSHIAYSAGQPKKAGQMTGARTIIDILRAAGLVKELDGKIVPNESQLDSVRDIIPTNSLEPAATKTSDKLIPIDAIHQTVQTFSKLPNGTAQCALQINIDLKVECKPEDLDTMGAKLRSILDSLSQDIDRITPES